MVMQQFLTMVAIVQKCGIGYERKKYMIWIVIGIIVIISFIVWALCAATSEDEEFGYWDEEDMEEKNDETHL